MWSQYNAKLMPSSSKWPVLYVPQVWQPWSKIFICTRPEPRIPPSLSFSSKYRTRNKIVVYTEDQTGPWFVFFCWAHFGQWNLQYNRCIVWKARAMDSSTKKFAYLDRPLCDLNNQPFEFVDFGIFRLIVTSLGICSSVQSVRP